MRIAKMMPLADYPVNIAGILALSGFPLGTGSNNNSAIGVQIINDDKWLQAPQNTYSMAIPIVGIGLNNTGVTVIGFRVYTDIPSNCHAGTFATTNGATAIVAVGSQPTAALAGVVANTPAYLEVSVNWQTGEWAVCKNGVKTWALTLTPAQLASILSTYSWVFLGGRGSGGGTWDIKDIHIREYDPGETYVPWVSPKFNFFAMKNVVARGQQRISIAADSLGGAETATYALAQPMVDLSTSLQVPAIQAAIATDANPMMMSPDIQNTYQGNVVGVEVFDTMKCSDATVPVLGAVMVQNGIAVSGPSQTVTSTMNRKNMFNVVDKNADGSGLTNASINASNIVIGHRSV